MADDLNTEIKIGADASGVEAGVGRAKRSLKDLGESAKKAGQDAGAGIGAIGAGGDKAAKDVERATKSMQGSLQRLLAEQVAGAKGSREYYEALADSRGISRNAIKPILDQIDAAKAKTLQAKAAADSWTSSLGKVAPLVATAFSGAAITGFLGKVVSVQREFDVLNSSLKTVTGSSAAAERELAWLKDFAKETPFGLAQATQAFVKMKALGLDPTRAALTSFGNTASAMGKDLNQMIEAVADASTGEFERLKEFGIKAKKEGDNVSLTFQGVTTTIGNSAREITKYLEDIGNTSFGGAMEERAKTLDGTIAALGDTWDELFRTVSTNNVGSLIFDSVTLANGALEDATTLLRAMGGAAQDASRDTGALSTIQNGIATVFETVAVLGANLKFVLVGIGNEIGGLAAQVAQAAQFNFSGVAAIRSQMVADAEAARKEIDATTARILNARKAQEEFNRSAAASTSGDFSRMDRRTSAVSPQVTTPGTNAAGIRAANKALEDQAKLIAELSGLSGSFAADWDTLNKLYAKGKLSLDGLTEAQSKLLAKQPAIAANIKAEEEAWRASLKTAQQIADARNKEIDGIQAWIEAQEQAARQALQSVADRVASLRDEEQAVGLAVAQNISLAEAVEQVALARLQEKQAGFYEGSDGYEAIQKEIAARKELLGLVRGKAQREAATDAAKKAADEWQRTADDINQSLTEALMRGFESGKGFAENLRQTVVNMFKTMVLRPIISAVVNPVAGALTGALGFAGTASAATGAASGLSTIGTAASGLSLATGLFGSGVKAGFGALFGEAGIGGALSASTTAIGAGNIAGGLGTAIGALGPIVLGIGVLASGLKRTLKDVGIQGSFGGAEGFTGQQYKFYEGGFLRSDKTTTEALDPAVQRSLASAFQGIQNQIAGFATALKLPTDQIKAFTTEIKFSTSGLDEAGVQKVIGEALATGSNELAQQIIGTWTTATSDITQVIETGITESLGTTFETIQRTVTESTYTASEFARENEKAIDTLSRLATGITTVNGTFETLGFALFDVSLAGADAASQLIDATGGIEAFSQKFGAYYEAYYSEEEKRANVIRGITRTLRDVGAQVTENDIGTATKQQFRAIYESIVAVNGAADPVALAMLNVSSAFASLFDSAGQAEGAMRGLQQRTKQLQVQLLEAQGDIAAALDLQRTIDTEGYSDAERAVYDYNRALQDQINAVNDAQRAAEEYAGAQKRAAEQQIEATRNAAQARLADAQSAIAAATSSIDAILGQATSAYVTAQNNVLEAQQNVASVLRQQAQDAYNAAKAIKDFGQSLRDFVNGEIGNAQQTFKDTLTRALAGDQEAMRSLPNVARSAAADAQRQAASAAEARLAEARIFADVLRVANIASSTTLPSVPEQVDPLVAANQELAKSQLQLSQALATANAIGAPLTIQVTDLIGQFTKAQSELAAATAEAAAAQAILQSIDENTSNTSLNTADQILATATLQASLNQISINTGISATNSTSTGATMTVSFAPNDPLRSIFENIGRTNELLIDAQQQTLQQLLGVAIGENLQALGSTNSQFEGTYKLTLDSRNYLQAIAYEVSNIARRSVGQDGGIYVKFARGDAPGQNVFAKGGAFTNGVVSQPTMFAMGLMGEAGPEAIMPLARTANGDLGVQVQMPNWKNYGNNAVMQEIVRELQAARMESRAQARLISDLQQELLRLHKRWDRNGLPEERVTS